MSDSMFRVRRPTKIGAQKAYLIELQVVQDLEQFPVLLRVLKLDIVLLQAVQRQLGFVHVDFHGLKKGEERGRDQVVKLNAKRCQTI